MVILKGKWSAVALVAGMAAAMQSAPAFSAMQTWDWSNSSNSFSSNNFGNSLSMTSSDGINLTVTGWSDTNDSPGPDEIQTGKLIWAQSGSLGIQNRDEDTNSPDHSIDSVTSDADGEFDMLLLEFDTAVSLSGIDLSWGVDGSASNRADISILAYDGTGSAGLNGETWSDIFSSNGGNYDSIGNYNNVGLSYYSVNSAEVESTAWLIGVYNPTFGDSLSAGNDGFKLDLIKTETTDGDEPPGEVPVPGSVPLLLLGLALLRGRLSARSKQA